MQECGRALLYRVVVTGRVRPGDSEVFGPFGLVLFRFFSFSGLSSFFSLFFLPLPPQNIKTIIAQRRLPAFDSGRHARLTYRPASGRPTAGRQVGLDRGRRPGGRRNGGFGGQRPPTENLNDFHNDFPPAGEAGGKKSKKYYYNNNTNNLLMMMMIFSLFPPKILLLLLLLLPKYYKR